MGKHSKNNCALPYYTYAERTRDAKRQGYGTRTTRISKDSVKDFDACWLTLQPCRDPVITYGRARRHAGHYRSPRPAADAPGLHGYSAAPGPDWQAARLPL